MRRSHKSLKKFPLFLLVFSLLFPASVGHSQQSIAEFTLPAVGGPDFSLADCDKAVVVVVFLGVECPLVELYAPALRELASRYANHSVQFVAINANSQDSLADLQDFQKKHPLGFPLLKDADQEIADLFHASRTPEAFVLDRDRRVCYRGRIDDQYGIGYRRPAPQQEYLVSAVEHLLQNQPVEITVTNAVGCKIGRRRPVDPNSDVTWYGQVERIVQDHCQQCHRSGQIAPFALTEYEEARAWGETIEEVVQQDRMPPWGANRKHGSFLNDPSLTPSEKDQVAQWVHAGCPAGDPAQGSAPRGFTEGWQLDRPPDLILPMSEEPFVVPADGIVEYQYFIADPKLTEGRWVVAAECRPSNPRVVHHVSLFLLLPELQSTPISRLGEVWSLQKNLLSTYVPGMRPVTFPAGTAYYMPPGTKIVFQVHYTPVGTEEADCCQVGLLFADSDSIERQLTTLPLINSWFEILPGDAAHVVEAWHTFREETLIHGFFPHMHLRGRAFRYVAHLPDGVSQILCDIPSYQFDWQTRYLLKVPISMPPGSRIQCIATYDNSSANSNNPDPDATVRWGDQSFEEMMIGYLDVSTPRSPATGSLVLRPVHSIPWLTVALGAAFLASATTLWGLRTWGGDRNAS